MEMLIAKESHANKWLRPHVDNGMKQTTEKSILWDRLLQFFIFCQESTQQLWFEKTEMLQSIDIFPAYNWPKGKVHLFFIPCTVFKYLH